ncbi:GNAT family N-acetyltransferase [Candidatus Sumerlaeota bacterium]|nr:GNAT family N-acetyltransferase [Candidatus Sumerlaeota bacterium]
MSESPTLEGPRIILRGVRLEDAPPLFELARDPGVTRYLTWPTPTRVEETDAFIRSALAEQAQGHSCAHFCITLGQTHRPIGVTSLTGISQTNRRATTGSWIGQVHWRQGLMRETKALILEFAFETLGLERVEALVDIDNQRSLSSLEACGFRREGVARRALRRGDCFTSAVMMAVLRGEHVHLVRRALGREPRALPSAWV